MQDLALLRWYHKQTKFSAEMMANILQNMSQNRDNKTITSTDLKYALTAAFLNIYPDTNLCSIKAARKHGYWCEVFTYYVRGNANGTASIIWAKIVGQWGSTLMNTPQSQYYADIENLSNRPYVKNLTNVAPSAILPELSIMPGEIKVILEACLTYSYLSNFKLPNGANTSTVDYSKIFGFYLIKPKYTQRTSEERACFHSIVIFTPKPGLFSETAPQ